MTFLMTAAIDLTPSHQAVQAILDVVGVAALQPGGCLGLSAKHALFSRRLDLVKYLVEAAPDHEPPKLKSLSKSDRKAAGLKHERPAQASPFSPSLGIVNEILSLTPTGANALTRSITGLQSIATDLKLLPHEADFIDMVKLLCKREVDSAPELLLRLMVAQFSRLIQDQSSPAKNLNCVVLMELCHQLDICLDTEKTLPWPIAPGLAEDFSVNLLQLAITFRCADLIEKLKPVLTSLDSTRTGPWIGAMLNRPIGDDPSHLTEFVETLQALHACGVDLNQPITVAYDKTRVNLSYKLTDQHSDDASIPRTPLVRLAMKRNAKNEVILNVMACLLDLGVDAQAKDDNGKTAANHLPAAYRARWNALARSKKSLSQARAALAEIFDNEIFGNEASNDFRKHGNSTGSAPGSLGRI